MNLEQRIGRLERSASRYRLGCVLLALTMLLKLSLGAEPVLPKVSTFNDIICTGLTIVNAKGHTIAALTSPDEDTNVFFQLGADDCNFPIRFQEQKDGSAVFMGQEKGNFTLSLEVNNNFALMNEGAIGDKVVALRADKTGGMVVATDLTDHYSSLRSDGLHRGNLK